jgi:hypothetical protein
VIFAGGLHYICSRIPGKKLKEIDEKKAAEQRSGEPEDENESSITVSFEGDEAYLLDCDFWVVKGKDEAATDEDDE